MAIAQQAQQPNRDPSKPKKPRFSHTANTKYGMGDNYGSGVRQKLGRVISLRSAFLYDFSHCEVQNFLFVS